MRPSVVTLTCLPWQFDHQRVGQPGRQLLERVLYRLETLEFEHLIGSGTQLAHRLRSAQHQDAHQGMVLGFKT